MANMMKMMKQAASMKKEMKNIQQNLEKQTVEYSCKGGKVVVVAAGDMSIKSVKIESALAESADCEAIEKLVVEGVNGALGAAKKKAAAEMTKAAGGLGGLADMLG